MRFAGWLAGIAVAVAMAAGAWWLASGRGPGPVAPPESMGAERAPVGIEDVPASAPEPSAPPLEPPAPPAEAAETSTGEDSSTAVPESAIHGVVTDEAGQAPIANAVLRAGRERPSVPPDDSSGGSSPASFETHTDALGKYALVVTIDEDYLLTCRAPGYIPSQLPLTPGQSVDMPIDFVLSRGARVSGTVTDSVSNAPIGGVRIAAMPVDAAGGAELLGQAVTGPDGAYAIDGLPAGPCRLDALARDQGYLPLRKEASLLELADKEDRSGVNISLELGASVQGTVHDASGAAVAGARVEPMPAQWMEMDAAAIRLLDVRAYAPLTATTDEQGRFRVDGLEWDAPFRLYVSKPGQIDAASAVFRVARGAEPPHVEVALGAGTTVSGQAQYEDGAPAGGVTLLLQPQLRPWISEAQTGPKTTITSPEGAFMFAGIDAGRYAVQQANAQNMAGRDSIVYVEADGTSKIEGLVLTAKKRSTSITGVVIDPSGVPAPDLAIEAGPAGSPAMRTLRAMTGPDGRFVFEKLEGPRHYDLVVSSHVGVAVQQKVEVGEEVTLQLIPPNRLAGGVFDEKGAGVAGVTVFLAASDDQAFPVMFATKPETQSKVEGHFEFQNVPAGTYTVEVRDKNHGSASSEPVTITPGVQRDDVRIVLKANPAFAGVVIGPLGQPIGGVSIALFRQSPNEMADLLRQTKPGQATSEASGVTDASGAFSMANVVPGVYMLVASHDEYARTQLRGTVVMPGKDIAGFRVGMALGGSIVGQCSMAGGAKGGVAVQCVGPGGVYVAAPDEEGKFRMDRVPAGAYMIQTVDVARVAREGSRAAAAAPTQVLDVFDGQTSYFDETQAQRGVDVSGVVMGGEKGQLIAVTVRMPGGKLPEQVRPGNLEQAVEQARFLGGKAIAGPDGSYHIRNVRPGKYLLEVAVLDFDPASPAALEANANADRAPRVRQDLLVGESSMEVPPIVLPPRE